VRRFIVVVISAAWMAALAVVDPALARPRVDRGPVRFGIVAELTGTGCVSATLARSTEGDHPLRSIRLSAMTSAISIRSW
jgi:hypothetical protein